MTSVLQANSAKAVLTNRFSNEKLRFTFNPEKLQVTVSGGSSQNSPFGAASSGGSSSGTSGGAGQGRSRRTTNSSNGATAGASGTTANQARPPTITLRFMGSLYLDRHEDPDLCRMGPDAVQLALNMLYSWMQPVTASDSNAVSKGAAVLDFDWGQRWFTGTIQGTVTCAYTMFDGAGYATRAEVTGLTLAEFVPMRTGQNPSSGALSRWEGRLIADGDSLQSIAFTQYGQARLWRRIAEVNGIDDPLRVRAGTMIVLPSLAELLEGA
jgi:hypothetical protein